MQLVALVAYGHEAEEVVVLRTSESDGTVRETRLWVVDHEGAPWIVTGREGRHDRNLAANPRVDLDEIAVALRFEPCPEADAPARAPEPPPPD